MYSHPLKVLLLLRYTTAISTVFEYHGYHTWNNSLNYCVTNGKILATLDSEEKYDDVKLFLDSNSHEQEVWIGLRYNGTDFVFPDKSICTTFYWDNAEPSDLNTRQCVMLTRFNHRYHTAVCSRVKNFVCEGLPVDQTTAASSVGHTTVGSSMVSEDTGSTEENTTPGSSTDYTTEDLSVEHLTVTTFSTQQLTTERDFSKECTSSKQTTVYDTRSSTEPSESTTSSTPFHYSTIKNYQSPSSGYCSCPCVNITQPTVEELNEIIRSIKLKLLLKTRTLSSYRRKKMSAEDYRPSSACMGYVSVIMIIVIIGFLTLSDMTNVCITVQRFYRKPFRKRYFV